MYTDVSYTFENVSGLQAGCLVFEDETLTRLEFEVLGEVVVTACEDIFGLRGVADDLCITLHIHRGGAVGAVEDGEHGLALILTGDDIDAVKRSELRLLTLDDNIVALAPVEQTREPREHGLF